MTFPSTSDMAFAFRPEPASKSLASSALIDPGRLNLDLVKSRARQFEAVPRDFALRQLTRAEAINDVNDIVLSEAAGKVGTMDLLARGRRTDHPTTA